MNHFDFRRLNRSFCKFQLNLNNRFSSLIDRDKNLLYSFHQSIRKESKDFRKISSNLNDLLEEFSVELQELFRKTKSL